MKRLCTPFAVAVLAAGLTACGGGGENSGATETGAQATSTNPAGASTSAAVGGAEKAKGPGVQLGSPAEVPRSEGGDNSIQDFGSEASNAERAAAARVLAAFLAAYAKGDGAKACALLSSSASEQLEQSFGQAAAKAGGSAPGCARTLSEFGSHLTGQARRRLAIAKLLSLRVEGERAFAIYEAARGQAYVAPMAKESGAWRVGALGSPLL